MAPRSRTGCLTCRQRKLKCSEERPICAQCVKANRECIPSSGITFRHQQNPSMNATDHGEGSLKRFYGYKETFGQSVVWVDIPQNLTFVNTSNPYNDEEVVHSTGPSVESFADDLAALAKNATHYEENRRAHEYEQNQSYTQYDTHGLEALQALSAVATQDNFTQNTHNFAQPQTSMGHGEQAPSHQPPPTASSVDEQSMPNQHSNLDFILNPHQTPTNGNIDPRLHSETPADDLQLLMSPQQPQLQSPNHVRAPSYVPSFGRPRLQSKGSFYREPALDHPELGFLLRDFSERAGLWMDLFDLNLFFASNVPVLAAHCPLLLYSCVALAAKSLARVNGRKPVVGGQVAPSRQSKMERWPGPPTDAEGWVHKAREYYDLAVSLLRQSLSGASRPATSSLPEDILPRTVSIVQDVPLPRTDSDELVAATAILCVYEFLDASGAEWSRHLDGTKSLFDIAKDRMVPLTLPPSPASIAEQTSQESVDAMTRTSGLVPGRRAVFWNFARQDMLSAFINTTSTRLDTSDLQMWRSAGLKLTPEGFVCPSNPQHPEYTVDNAMSEDLISNALIWLQSKLVNFIGDGDDVPESISSIGLGVRQRELLEYWEGLDEQLRVWYEGLPDCFHPTAVRLPDNGVGIEEKWFPRPMCASTMQSYHFARIQLLHNKPHLTTAMPLSTARSQPSLSGQHASPGTSLAARHASYASILQQSRIHAKEIVAIGLGRSDEGARIHSVQPLWTAGLVLGIAEGDVSEETTMWRRSIITQLRGIERDMGWASEYRVKSLLELRELPTDWGAESDAT